MNQADESAVTRKIFWRVVPLLMFLYIVSYIDRINVGFAALTMNREIGLSSYAFGWGAGIFFIGYFIFEIPSNLIMQKVGARRWIARILFTWGALSCCMALVKGPASFLVLRFLLGIAEAGFFPGVILYLRYWFPERYQARIVAAFMLSIPISVAVGAPVSTFILELDGALGLTGWQWLFSIEGLPAILGGFLVLRLLSDRPETAKWLSPAEHEWIRRNLSADRRAEGQTYRSSNLKQVFTNPAILALSFVYFCATGTNLGLSFFMPQIIKLHGFSTLHVGFVTAIPYIVGCGGMILIGHLSDRYNERKWFLVGTMGLATAGFAIAGAQTTSLWSIFGLTLAAVGVLGSKGPFWPLPAKHLRGEAMAGGIAFINAIGNLGGFVGPLMLGFLKDGSKDFKVGLYCLAAVVACAALITIVFVSRHPDRSPSAGEAAVP
jgi:ACS family tartrate transporter-like MFS transporter